MTNALIRWLALPSDPTEARSALDATGDGVDMCTDRQRNRWVASWGAWPKSHPPIVGLTIVGVTYPRPVREIISKVRSPVRKPHEDSK